MNARPHPDPLPRGEGTPFVNAEKFVSVSRESDREFAVEAASDSPSPWGEGQGEEGRYNSIQSHGN
jgi:hypothetical protein